MNDREAASRLFRHARREAIFVLIVFVLALLWTVGYCYLHGYQHAPDSWVVRTGLASVRAPADVRLYFGMPDWVAVGVVLPWLICTAVTILFCLVGMKDDDLGVEAEEGSHVGH